MKPYLYMETTIPSYMVARSSLYAPTAARQAATLEWWSRRRGDFDVHISRIVLQECLRGDPAEVAKRKNFLQPFPILETAPEAEILADAFLRRGCLPAKAADDALHIALAAVHGMHFLLKWNCRHINNVEILAKLRPIAVLTGYELPVVCTPEELMGDTYEN